MIEENGHIWESTHPFSRCRKCCMKYNYYLAIKRASEEQPEEQPDREDLKEWMKCKPRK